MSIMKNIIRIDTIDPSDRKRNGDYCEYIICQPVPLVRRRIFGFFGNMLGNLSDEITEKLLCREINEKNMLEVFSEVIGFIEDNGLLEYFIAMIIRPIGVSERDKDIDEIASFLETNIKPATEMRIISGFFSVISIEDIAQGIRSIKKTLQMMIPENQKS